MIAPAGHMSKKYRNLFTPEEDQRLIQLVALYGTESWHVIAAHLPPRTSRQCRERYKTYLSPDVDVSPWTRDEDRLLVQKVQQFGCKWAQIRGFFGQRTVNNIKNRWNTVIRRLKSRCSTSSFEDDFVRCAQFIGEKSESNRIQAASTIQPQAEEIFSIQNLLN